MAGLAARGGRAPPGRSGLVALIPLLGLLWGLNWPVVRICLQEIPPWTLRCWGFSLATILMFAFVAARGGSLRVPRAHWGRLVIVGCLSVTGYNLFSAFAQLTASTTRSAVLSYTMPIWAVLFARLALGEPLDTRRLLGLGLGIAGLVALGWPLLQSGQLSWGLLYALLSGVVWAAGSTVLKRYPIDASPLVISSWQLALGAVTTLPGMLLADSPPDPRSLSGPVLVALGLHVVFAQAVATTLWFKILTGLPAGIAAIGSLLVPGIGVIGAALILGEHPTATDWTGLVLIVAASASVLVQVEPRPAPVRS